MDLISPFRRSIKDKRPKSIYIHLLQYQNLYSLQQKEWPTVINYIIKNHHLIYGHKLKVTGIKINKKEQIIKPLDKALRRIIYTKDKELKMDFKDYLDKIIPKLMKWYSSFRKEINNFYLYANKRLTTLK